MSRINKWAMAVIAVTMLWNYRAQAQTEDFPTIPGWTCTLESRVYDANDLWDIIDGAADLYLEYAFIDLHIARYTTGSGREVKAELYRHRDMENAFGMYTVERNTDYHFITIGTQGYQQSGVLNFTEGEFYIKLSSRQTDSTSVTDLQQIARAIDTRLHRLAAFPKPIGLFPAKGKDANSEQFTAQNFLGYGFLKSVYTASYHLNGVTFKTFIISTPSKAAGDSLLKTYCSKMPAGTITAHGAECFLINDPNNGPVVMATEGTYVYGMLACTDEAVRNDMVAELKKRLSAE